MSRGSGSEHLSPESLGRRLGHEFGHSLGLPHPPGCDVSVATCDSNALMYLGYFNYPNTYLRVDDKSTLNASPFISWRPISDAVFDYYEFTESNWFSSHQQSTLYASGWYQRSYFATNSSLYVLQNSSEYPALMYLYRGGVAATANAKTVFNRKVKTINAAQLKSGKCLTSPGAGDWLNLRQITCDSSNTKSWQVMR